MANNRTVMSTYLTEKITTHVAAVLEAYDVEHAWWVAEDIIEAIENEMIWAAKAEPPV